MSSIPSSPSGAFPPEEKTSFAPFSPVAPAATASKAAIELTDEGKLVVNGKSYRLKVHIAGKSKDQYIDKLDKSGDAWRVVANSVNEMVQAIYDKDQAAGDKSKGFSLDDLEGADFYEKHTLVKGDENKKIEHTDVISELFRKIIENLAKLEESKLPASPLSPGGPAGALGVAVSPVKGRDFVEPPKGQGFKVGVRSVPSEATAAQGQGDGSLAAADLIFTDDEDGPLTPTSDPTPDPSRTIFIRATEPLDQKSGVSDGSNTIFIRATKRLEAEAEAKEFFAKCLAHFQGKEKNEDGLRVSDKELTAILDAEYQAQLNAFEDKTKSENQVSEHLAYIEAVISQYPDSDPSENSFVKASLIRYCKLWKARFELD